MAEILWQDPVLSDLWELCISVSIVIGLLLLVRPVMKRMPRIGMYILWVMVVLRIACPFPLSGMYQFMPVSVGQAIADVKQSKEQKHISQTSAQKSAYGGAKNGYRLNSGIASEVTSKDSLEAHESSGKPQKREREKETSAALLSYIAVKWIILSVWLAGVFCCVIYLGRSLFRNRRHFKSAVHLFDNVYEHHDSCSSFVGGIIRPQIFVPEGTDGEALKCILVHERIHIRRWDYRIKPFAFLMFSVLWFNPLVWIAYRFLITDMEISCDEAVIRKMGSGSKKQYSYLLLTMASGENRMIRSHAAFGASVVKERIYHVMKYKKPTKLMTVLLTAAVMLCSCGIASSDPPETKRELPQTRSEENTDAVYVEQTMPMDITWSADEGVESYGGLMGVDRDGTYVSIQELRTVPEEKLVSFGKAVFESGEWKKADITWDKQLKKQLEGKTASIEGMYYDADNMLYLSFAEYSLPYSEYEKYEGREEEWYEVWYAVDQMLFRINEETGDVAEIDVPVAKKGDHALYNTYGFFADGNYFVQTEDKIVLYNGKTGEHAADLPQTQGVISQAGDDFIVSTVMNQETKSFDLLVQDEFGESSYVLQTGAKFDTEKEEYDGCAFGVSGNTILLATQEGIFEAEYGEDEFHRVIHAQKDNLYYLTPDSYKPEAGSVMWKGSNDSYMLSLEGEDRGVNCYYSKVP